MNQPWGEEGEKIDSTPMLDEPVPVIGTGEWDDIQCRYFKNEDEAGLRNGDIILVREGNMPIALCQVTGNVFRDDCLQQRYGNILFRHVRILDRYDGTERFPQTRKTLQRLIRKTPSWEFIHRWYSRIENNAAMKSIVDILQLKKQLILQGAPGTGKTYRTAELALRIMGENGIDYSDRNAVMEAYRKAVDNSYIAFTTFHQSMDYEEFVEGLRPDPDDNMNFSVHSGIFKTMCLNAQAEGNLDKLNQAIERLKEDCSEIPITARTRRGIDFSVTYRGGATFRVRSSKSEAEEGRDFPVNIGHLQRLYMGDVSGYNICYLYGILAYLKEHYRLTDYVATKRKRNYVLIIDEINRGNVAKIFGELITLLEADKRLGEENEIRVFLPYSPEAKFGVPSNLYIIGTMNTADRSLGRIDYAIRRRFAFVTLKADEAVLKSYYATDEAQQARALALFQAIREFVSSHVNPDFEPEDVMIGHSYFLCDRPEELALKLEYEIIPLLHEYERDGVILAQKEELVQACKEWMRQL